jgi:hypothetical protein
VKLKRACRGQILRTIGNCLVVVNSALIRRLLLITSCTKPQESMPYLRRLCHKQMSLFNPRNVSQSNITFFLTYVPHLNRKFWYKLIAYFSLIRHGPLRKQRLQQFFVAAGTSLPSCYLATIGGYTDPQTLFWYDTDLLENNASNNSALPRERLYRVFI